MRPNSPPTEIGRVFSRLTVIAESPPKRYKATKNKRPYPYKRWICRCICGIEKEIADQQLRSGHTRSCGCIRKGKPSNNRGIYGNAARHTVFVKIRASAINRDIVFELTKNQILAIVAQNCFYCGVAPRLYDNSGKCYGAILVNGIDRIDPEYGYVLENVCACCVTCNYMKQHLTGIDFFRQVRLIFQNKLANMPSYATGSIEKPLEIPRLRRNDRVL